MSRGRRWTDGRGRPGLLQEESSEEAPAYLKPGGWLCLEIGWDQGESLRSGCSGRPDLSSVEIVKDLAGLDRVAARAAWGRSPESRRSEEKMFDKLEDILIRLEEILRQLGEPGAAEDAGRISAAHEGAGGAAAHCRYLSGLQEK